MAVETEFQEEQNDERSAKKKSTRLQSFKTFLYDKETGKVLGRTGLSWLQIIVFYIVFYAFLAAFFAICLVVFLETLDTDRPSYFGKGSILGDNPGMGYQPWLAKDAESTLININVEKNSTYLPYVEQIEAFLKTYNDTAGNTRSCTGNDSNAEYWTIPPLKSKDLQSKQACNFYEKIKGIIDSSDKDGCNYANNFGYSDGRPCVIITVNKIIGWRPMAYPPDSVPDRVNKRYKPGNVAVDCVGEFTPDQENLGQVKYFPETGIEGRFFPYQKFTNYQQPFVFAKFINLRQGTLVFVECHGYAYNMVIDTTDRLGNVHFEMMIDCSTPGQCAGPMSFNKNATNS